MMLTRRAFLLPRAATRCLSTSAVRPWAMPSGDRGQQTQSSQQAPVDDIDLVFDYPTEAQTSHQKQPLEQSGLDLHSAMPHHVPGAKAGKEMAADHSTMYRYIGLGALGLGGLYMMMRRQSAGPVLTQSSEIGATKPGEGSSMQRVFGRDK